MNIAFHATMKPPDHAVPSGDRLMARLLMRALAEAGHDARLVSRLSSFSRVPDAAVYRDLSMRADAELSSLLGGWSKTGAAWKPACWFTYHPYYKAPDLLGPRVSTELGIPYVTAEASYAPRRDDGPWAVWQGHVVQAVRSAAINFCFTRRDRAGLERVPGRRGDLVDLRPFIDVEGRPIRAGPQASSGPVKLITVAMMRAGAKLDSYLMLAEALAGLGHLPWTLTIVGDGRERERVRAAFGVFPLDRIDWKGLVAPDEIARCLAQADLFVWPGWAEGYGLVYLEAQAAGLPVVAQHSGGVPEVVRADETGFLTGEGDVGAYRSAIARLVTHGALRDEMGDAAARFVRAERTLSNAAAIVGAALAALAARPA